MEITDFAKEILLGQTLTQKMVSPPASDLTDHAARLQSDNFEVPLFPGRPQFLSLRSRAGKKPFPRTHELQGATERGEVLHFFANHELLAMELMAVVLLKFPAAPPAFRLGIVKTIQEEQAHLGLYLGRMQELGVEFGTLPVNDYFWNCMKEMRSPLEFVTQMSLSFEQANLDFSIHYRDAVMKVGDEKTAEILDRVYREEIGHVKHGLIWFNRWRDENSSASPRNETEWQAYRRLLPPPMTPRRAKGIGFCAEARREAGFTEEYIQELEVCSGSKGRPPVLWSYNPLCDAEIVRGKPGLSPSPKVHRRTADLEHLPMFLAASSDTVWLSRRPPLAWLRSLQSLQLTGLEMPEFDDTPDPTQLTHEKLAGIEPWGWSPRSFECFKPLQPRLIHAAGARGLWHQKLLSQKTYSQTGIEKFFSKSWSTDFLRGWMQHHPDHAAWFGSPDWVTGVSVTNFGQALTHGQSLFKASHGAIGGILLKAPYGTSGMQNKRVKHISELAQEPRNAPLHGWMKNTLQEQGSLVIEPYLKKLCDLSIQLDIQDDAIRLLEVRRFLTGSRLEYKGTLLGQRLAGVPPEFQKFFNTALEPWQELLKTLGSTLQLEGYRGPAGVDALIYEDDAGALKLKPLVELNPRWTMGRIALALEKWVTPGRPSAWVFFTRRDMDSESQDSPFMKFAQDWQARHPLKLSQGAAGIRIQEGVLWTNPPECAQEILTGLLVGSAYAEWASSSSARTGMQKAIGLPL